MKDGLYHQNRLAVAPNGSISYINDTSASIHPITRMIEERQEKKIGKIYYPAPYLSNETIPYYTSAYDMDMRKVIDVYATVPTPQQTVFHFRVKFHSYVLKSTVLHVRQLSVVLRSCQEKQMIPDLYL